MGCRPYVGGGGRVGVPADVNAGAICRLFLAFDHGTHCHPIAFACNPRFRHFGFRTASEIDYERYALKSVRGDLDVIVAQGPANAEQLIETMRR